MNSKESNRMISDLELKERILLLKKQKNAILLAHYYQVPEIQDLADYVGDSLGLSQKALFPFRRPPSPRFGDIRRARRARRPARPAGGHSRYGVGGDLLAEVLNEAGVPVAALDLNGERVC